MSLNMTVASPLCKEDGLDKGRLVGLTSSLEGSPKKKVRRKVQLDTALIVEVGHISALPMQQHR